MRQDVYAYLRGRTRRGEIAKSTATAHRSVLMQFVDATKDKPAAKLTKRDVTRWLEAGAHWSPGTRRMRFCVVRAFVVWLVADDRLSADPFARMRAPSEPRRTPRALQMRQVVAILDSCPDVRAQLLVILMVQEGLRRKEVAGLQVGDIDFHRRMMRIVGKGNHERMLYVTDEADHFLAIYLGQFPATTGPLIRSYMHPKRGINPDTVSKIVTKAMGDAGVKATALDGVTPHALRHTAATDALRAGAHIRDVQAMLGHRSVQSTELYLPHLVGTLERAMGGRRYGTSERNLWDTA